MKRWLARIGSLIVVALVVWIASGGLLLAQGGNYFDDITVGGDVDIYGTGVIRDSLDDTVQQQVTSGGVTVSGVVTSPNIYGGYVGNAVSVGNFGAFIGGGGSEPSLENWVTGGINTISGDYGFIGSGTSINVTGDWGVVGGGAGNRILSGAGYATIGGGAINVVSAGNAFIGGGQGNAAAGQYGAIPGGFANWITAPEGFIGGGSYNYTGQGTGISVLGGTYNTIGTGRHGWYEGGFPGSMSPEYREPYSFRNTMFGQTASGDYSAIVGGSHNIIGDAYSFIGSGFENWVAGMYTQVVTVAYTLLDNSGCVTDTMFVACPSTYNTIVGGYWNTVSNARVDYDGIAAEVCQVDGYAFIGGGAHNIITGTHAQASFIGGGISNTITSTYGALSGGISNTVSGLYAAIPGGAYNTAGGIGAFAAGYRARALHTGSFVWADSQVADYSSPAADSFSIRAGGGVTMTTTGAGLALDGPVIVDGMAFTYTSPITITGVVTNVRLLFYQVP